MQVAVLSGGKLGAAPDDPPLRVHLAERAHGHISEIPLHQLAQLFQQVDDPMGAPLETQVVGATITYTAGFNSVEGSGYTARCMALSWVAGALSVLGRDDDARAAYRDLLATPDKGRVDKQGGNRGLQCHFNLRI